jgi:hypothetical protein
MLKRYSLGLNIYYLHFSVVFSRRDGMSGHLEGGQLAVLGGHDEPQPRLHRRSQIQMLRLPGKLDSFKPDRASSLVAPQQSDTQYNDTQNNVTDINDTLYIDTQNCYIQHNDTQHNETDHNE